jgi:hypothetical protein
VTSPAEDGRHRRRIAVGVVTLFVLGVGAVVAVRLLQVRDGLQDARSDLSAARGALVLGDDARAEAAVARGDRRLDAAAAAADSRFLRALRVVPLLGSPARAAADAAAAAREAVAAARLVVGTGGRLRVEGGEAMQARDFSRFHGAAVESSAALARAGRHLEAAADRLRGTRAARLPMVSGPARAMARDVDEARRQLGTAERALRLLTSLVAPGTDVRLLVVAQDTYELRPAGGYIGSYGVVRFAQGRVALERYDASEALPFPDPPMEPPAALAPALPQAWAMSNGNWWPDFPTSARTVAELFRRQGGGAVDGVVAVTEDAAGRLVGVVEPVQVPGYVEPVVEAGFGQRALYEVGLKEPRDVPRKKFLISLAAVLFDELLALPESELPQLGEALGRSVRTGELQVWFADEGRQALVAPTALSGSLPAVDGDFLMLVDANMSGSKANLGLVKEATYRVRREDGRWRAHLEVVVRNEAPFDPRLNPYYNGYLRVYAPGGSRLTVARPDQGEAGPAPDGPYQVFAQLLDVAPGAEQRVAFDYELPDGVAEGERYRLTWVRQVGTPRDVLAADAMGAKGMVPERTLVLERSLRGHPVAEWLEDRWIVRRLTGG